MLLNSKVVIVTGAASARGIGKATAKALAAQGARVVILDLRKEDAESAAHDLGEDHLGLACDVTDKAACIAAAKAVVDKYGRVDGLINNAGITQPLKTMDIE
ncbi:SDR family NAD(P)-dependent oxidoreductase, partial [Caballeronia terrestris]|uniref:SDR family NAD(P)-dependent oxidoreductase n=1 Tax=Caballeronia terrestris TaxID=1226301 RepID=UPI000AA8BD7E